MATLKPIMPWQLPRRKIPPFAQSNAGFSNTPSFPGQTPGFGGGYPVVNPGVPGATQPGFPGGDGQSQSNAPAWLQKLHGGLGKMFGANQQNPYLDPQEQQAAAQQQKMAMIAALAQASGPRPKGTGSVIGDFGTAIQAGQQASQQSTADAMRARIVAAQMAAMQNSGQQERAEPAQVRIARILSDPNEDPQVKEEIRSQLKAEGATEQQIEQMRLQIMQMDLSRQEREDVRTERDERETNVRRENTIVRGLEQTGKIAELTKGLEGTFLEAGVPLSDLRRAGAATIASLGAGLGFDTSKQREMVSKFDQLKKNTQDQLINLMSTGGLGEATNQKLVQYQAALASPETSPGAIMAIQASIGEILLSEAEAAGFEIPNRAEIEARIEEMKNYSSPAPGAAVDVPGVAQSVQNFAKMSLEQLQSIDMSQMSTEALEAAKKRWDELNAR